MDVKDNYEVLNYQSESEKTARLDLAKLMTTLPIPLDQLSENAGLFLNSKTLSRILFFSELYQQFLDVQGVMMEFGCRWGQTLALLSALRGIYEPFNRHRKLIGFDTFKGFPSIADEDGRSKMMYPGHLTVPEHYEDSLAQLLTTIEQDNPLGHIQKHELCVGDVTQTLPQYLERNPHTIVAFAYFDLDLYQPTKECLEFIRDRLVKGSIVGFDELNDPDSPGETLAVMETLGLPNIALRRSRIASRVSYFIV